MHTKKKKSKMGQKRGKDGEGEVTKGKREGIQPLQVQLRWKTLDIASKALRSKLGSVFPAIAGKVAVHLGLQLV